MTKKLIYRACGGSLSSCFVTERERTDVRIWSTRNSSGIAEGDPQELANMILAIKLGRLDPLVPEELEQAMALLNLPKIVSA